MGNTVDIGKCARVVQGPIGKKRFLNVKTAALKLIRKTGGMESQTRGSVMRGVAPKVIGSQVLLPTNTGKTMTPFLGNTGEFGLVDNPTITEIALGAAAAFISWIVKLHNDRIENNSKDISEAVTLIRTIQTEQINCRAEMSRRLERGDACFDCLEEKMSELTQSTSSLASSIVDLRHINDTLAGNIRKIDDRMWEKEREKK